MRRCRALVPAAMWTFMGYVVAIAWLSPRWPDVIRVLVTGLAAAALAWFEAQRRWEMAYRVVKRQLEELKQADAERVSRSWLN